MLVRPTIISGARQHFLWKGRARTYALLLNPLVNGLLSRILLPNQPFRNPPNVRHRAAPLVK